MKRAFSALSAVLVTIAIVIGFRAIVRYIATESYKSERTDRVIVPPVERAEKELDLTKIIPKNLEVSMMGVSADISERLLTMPLELAEKVTADEAEAKGWVERDESTDNRILAKIFSQKVYERPDKSLVLQRLIPGKGETTIVKEFLMPTAEVSTGANENTTIDQLETVRGYQILNAMPSVIKETIVGLPAMTMLIRRGEGASFIVRAVSNESVAKTTAEVKAAFEKHGWVKRENLDRGYRFMNLSAMTEVKERVGSIGSEVVYRYSDDEVYLTTKGTQE